DIDLDIGRKMFASGLLPEVIAALRRSSPGDLVTLAGEDESIGPELETWCRFTGNPLLEATVENGRARWVSFLKSRPSRFSCAFRTDQAIWPVMVRWLGILLGTLRSTVRTHRELALENLALRQQLAVWKARQPRPQLTAMARRSWGVLSRLWKSWRNSLQMVGRESGVGWH